MVVLALVLTLAKLGSAAADRSGTPGPPTGLVAVVGDGSVRVWFDGSSSAGASPIRHYRVSIFHEGQDTEFHTDGTTSPITVRGLTNGVSYTAKVKARNSSGFGASAKPTPAFVSRGKAAATSPGNITSTTTSASTAPSTRTTPPARTRTTSASSVRVPGDVLDLRRWRPHPAPGAAQPAGRLQACDVGGVGAGQAAGAARLHRLELRGEPGRRRSRLSGRRRRRHHGEQRVRPVGAA